MKMPRGWIVTAVAMVAWLAAFRPWTIRSIAEVPRGPFDAGDYVAKIWDARAVPSLGSSAVPFATYQGRPHNRATAVSLDGLVIAVNTSSRVGVASVDVAPEDGRPDALLMVGPVIRGTALRDALDFIQFTNFTNQIQFAEVANALNDRVLVTALAHVEPAALKGRRIHVLGVAWSEPNAPDAPPFVVPVQLSIGGRP
jgi:predicted lipoprotein